MLLWGLVSEEAAPPDKVGENRHQVRSLDSPQVSAGSCGLAELQHPAGRYVRTPDYHGNRVAGMCPIPYGGCMVGSEGHIVPVSYTHLTLPTTPYV